MTTAEAVLLLRRILSADHLSAAEIGSFQRAVWDGDVVGEPSQLEVLSTLALDLDYFEPSPAARTEDPSFIDEEQARHEIARVVGILSPRG